ncbi:MAG: nucleotidyl transferase AbiEii/AbiGii toxin family protein [Elusimicrobia bacterium]|nr:nucleotidyl transferase AbiEii/AbiGii toxin family protein [Elusimicrobiota bacterium]
MAFDPFSAREFFHLVALRHLSGRLSGRAWALKGGVCLRLFHGSARLSEDMDLDVDPRVRRATLEKGIDAVLGSAALRADLVREGLAVQRVSKPKQTETTQRWKVELALAGEAVQTKLEFSRRRDVPGSESGAPAPQLLDRYGVTQFAARHYGAAEMARQKTAALASEGRNAVRDLYDLDLLWSRNPTETSAAVAADPAAAEAAAAKAERFAWGDFQGQVLPYLESPARRAYGRDAFEGLKASVCRNLRAVRA